MNGVRTTTLVQLNGQPSQDEATYSWVQDPADAFHVTLSAPNDDKPTFLAPDVGPNGATLHFTLTVSGCSPPQFKSTTTTVTVTNVASNQPPVASATVTPSTGTVNEGDLITLDGSGSSDPDGDLLSYSWARIVDGAPVAFSTLATATFTAPTDVPYPAGASLTFRLTVSDGFLSSSTEKIVTVRWVNDPPIARVACPSEVAEGKSIFLDGSASSDDADGIVSYDWSQIAGGPDAGLTSDALKLQAFTFDAPQLSSTYDTMSFKLIVTDLGGLFSSAECSVRILDVTPPVITGVQQEVTREAASAAGATVSFALGAHDAVDGDVPVYCSPASGSLFPLGSTAVNCSASDTKNNTATASFTVTVVDTTPPTVLVPSDLSPEATDPSGATTTFTATATDLVDGARPVTCTPASGSVFPLGSSTVTCSAADTRGNSAHASFTVTVVDTTPPAITVPADSTTGPTEATGAKVSYGGVSARDLVDGSVSVNCTPVSGSLFKFGTTTVTCTATDQHQNVGSKAFSVTVSPFTFMGFFQPVDNIPALNTVKNGSTVPLKWKLQGQGSVEITDVGAVASTHAWNVSCGSLANAVETAIELTTTGGTSLRYDSSAMQFILNWQTPKQAGTCWRVDVTFQDGRTHSADFKLK